MTKCACKTEDGKNCKNSCEHGKIRCRSHRGKRCSPRSGSKKTTSRTRPRKSTRKSPRSKCSSPGPYAHLCGYVTNEKTNHRCMNNDLVSDTGRGCRIHKSWMKY